MKWKTSEGSSEALPDPESSEIGTRCYVFSLISLVYDLYLHGQNIFLSFIALLVFSNTRYCHLFVPINFSTSLSVTTSTYLQIKSQNVVKSFNNFSVSSASLSFGSFISICFLKTILARCCSPFL